MLADQREHGIAEARPYDEAIIRQQCVVLHGKELMAEPGSVADNQHTRSTLFVLVRPASPHNNSCWILGDVIDVRLLQ